MKDKINTIKKKLRESGDCLDVYILSTREDDGFTFIDIGKDKLLSIYTEIDDRDTVVYGFTKENFEVNLKHSVFLDKEEALQKAREIWGLEYLSGV